MGQNQVIWRQKGFVVHNKGILQPLLSGPVSWCHGPSYQNHLFNQLSHCHLWNTRHHHHTFPYSDAFCITHFAIKMIHSGFITTQPASLAAARVSNPGFYEGSRIPFIISNLSFVHQASIYPTLRKKKKLKYFLAILLNGGWALQ